MCKYHNPRKIDECMKNICYFLDEVMMGKGKVIACCCGHGRYNHTILIKNQKGVILEICSKKYITRKKRFYIKDKNGYYYIPEIIKNEMVRTKQ